VITFVQINTKNLGRTVFTTTKVVLVCHDVHAAVYECRATGW